MGERIEHAKTDWSQGALRSVSFSDIYFSGDGPAETRHVFLAGNLLAERFFAGGSLTICEFGFGTGLNFLETSALFDAAKARAARLHFVSVEAAPLSASDLARTHVWPEHIRRAERLRARLPPLAPGLHALEIDDDVTLTLAYGDAFEVLRGLEGQVDAWFFDGFAPAKNPQMWRPELFVQAARLSRRGATFATYTVAGDVRRALTAAGFVCDKRQGFGRKKEMLVGTYEGRHVFGPQAEGHPPPLAGKAASGEAASRRKSKAIDLICPAPAGASRRLPRKRGNRVLAVISSLEFASRTVATEAGIRARRARWFQNASAARLNPGDTLAIIGGGIAGASLAYAARRAGLRPTIIEAEGLAAGASGNVAGLIMPRLDLGAAPAARFFTAAYLHTIRLLIALDGDVFRQCGVLLGAGDERAHRRHDALAAAQLLPEGWIERRNGGLWFPQGGVVDPERLVAALASDALIIRARARGLRRREDVVVVDLGAGRSEAFSAAVLANGCAALRFWEARTLPLRPVAGQIDWFPDAAAPAHGVAFGPYAAPALRGGLVVGSTYEPGASDAEASLAATRSNLTAIAAFAPHLAAGLDARDSKRRASLRCQTPDRIPVAGPLPDWEFFGAHYDDLRLGRTRDYPTAQMIPRTQILAGLGSRGLVTAPLAAAHLVAEMTGTLSPLDFAQAEALHPARFFIRDLKRAGRRASSTRASLVIEG
jgi:tRNA 5-methylaminomethyl-2-thiouridine biosynthesis bifunctional protein